MDFKILKETVANECLSLGVSEYEIYFENSESTSVEMLKDDISGFSSNTSAGICLRLLKDGKMGYASSELLTQDEMRELVYRAIENAKNTEKEDTVGIYQGSKEYKPCKNGNENKPLETAEIKEIARKLQTKLYKYSEKIVDGTQSLAACGEREVRIVNSHGLDLSRRVSTNLIMAQAAVCENGENESNYCVKEYKKGDSLDAVVKEATDGALSKIGAKSVGSGKYPTVISGKQMRALLSVYSSVFNARNVQMGMSLLRGRLGEKIAADCVTLTDDADRNSASVHFDAEGVATYRKSVIENGILKTFLHNRETALKDGVETTANASKSSYASPVGISPYVFCIEAGSLTLDELFAKASDGVYITELKGLHAGANAVTGDFSLECGGYLIKNGKRADAIKSFTVAGNFFELLMNIDSLSNDLQISASQGGFTTFGSPDVLLKEASIAGK